MTETFRQRLERINREQLALNDTADRGLWQDMTPYLDDIAEALAPKITGYTGETLGDRYLGRLDLDLRKRSADQ